VSLTGRTPRRIASGTFRIDSGVDTGGGTAFRFHGSWGIFGFDFDVNAVVSSGDRILNCTIRLPVGFSSRTKTMQVNLGGNIASAEGEWSMFVDMEELFEWTLIQSTPYGITAAAGETQIRRTQLRLFERGKAGGAIYMRLAVGGQEIVHARTQGVGPTGLWEAVGLMYPETHYEFSAFIEGQSGDGGAGSSYIQVNSLLDGVLPDVVAVDSRSVSNPPFPDGVQTFGWSAGRIEMTTSNFTGVFSDPFYGMLLRWKVPEEYRLKGGVNDMKEPYPQALECKNYNQAGASTAFTAGPGIDTTQRRRKTLGSWGQTGLGGHTTVFSEDGGYGIRAQIDPAELTAAGESNDNRLLFRLPPFTALTLSQAQELLVDACSSATGWTNASLVGGVVRADGSAGQPERLYSPQVYSESYRYLDIEIRSVGSSNAPVSVSHEIDAATTLIGTLKTGADGEWVRRRIDLCAPPSGLTVDDQDSRWPLRAGSSDVPVNAKAHWGINRILKLKYGIGSAVVEFRRMELARAENPRLSLLTSERQMDYRESTTDKAYRCVTAETDGRRSLEFPGLLILGGSNLYRTMANLRDDVNANRKGWALTLNSASQNLWNFAWDVAYLGGAGAIYTGGSPVWWIDKPIFGAQEIQSQVMVDVVVAPPGSGGLLIGQPDQSGPLVLPIWKILRGQYCGLVVDGPQVVPGATVTATEDPSGDSAGEGTTDQRGFYRTGAPYARGGKAHDLEVVPGGATAASSMHHRHQRRVSFGEVPKPGGNHHKTVLEDVGLLFDLTFNEGLIQVERFDNRGFSETFHVVEDDGITSAQIARHPGGHLWVVFGQAGQVFCTESWSYGEHWTEPEVVADGIYPSPATCPNTGISLIVQHEGGDWLAYRQVERGEPWEHVGDVVTAAATGPGGLEIHGSTLSEAVFTVTIAGATRRFQSTSYGEDWEEI
jgi:hypothetical protein